MSVRVMSAVWDRANAGGNELLVLLAIADWANDYGLAYPSVRRIAEKTRISERTVQRLLQDLEDRGELEVERATGRGHLSRYWVTAIREKVTPEKGDNLADSAPSQVQADDNLSAILEGDEEERVTSDEKVTPEAERVTSRTGKGDTAMSPDPSEIRQKEPSSTTRVRAREVLARTGSEPKPYELEELATEYADRLGIENARRNIAECRATSKYRMAVDKLECLRDWLDEAVRRARAVMEREEARDRERFRGRGSAPRGAGRNGFDVVDGMIDRPFDTSRYIS